MKIRNKVLRREADDFRKILEREGYKVSEIENGMKISGIIKPKKHLKRSIVIFNPGYDPRKERYSHAKGDGEYENFSTTANPGELLGIVNKEAQDKGYDAINDVRVSDMGAGFYRITYQPMVLQKKEKIKV